MQIEVISATAGQEPVLANLLELYTHDFSEFHDLELGPDGRFGYRDLPLYWLDPDRHPFLVRIDGRLAGLILVKKGPAISGEDTVWDMAEFFVLRGCRRRGVGTEIAHQVWEQFPGRWQIRVMHSNHAACAFWKHAIAEFASEAILSVRFDKGGESWHLFSFESRGAT